MLEPTNQTNNFRMNSIASTHCINAFLDIQAPGTETVDLQCGPLQ